MDGVDGACVTPAASVTASLLLVLVLPLLVQDLKDRNLALGKKYGATHAYKLPHAHASTMEAVKADFPDGFDIVVGGAAGAGAAPSHMRARLAL